MNQPAILRQFDYFLFITVLVLAFIGALGIYSASADGSDGGFFYRQLAWIALGVVACFVVMSIDYHFLSDHAFLIYGLAISVLILVLFFGTEVNNSKSWIVIAGFRFQPSEAAKLALILVLARYLAEVSENHLTRGRVITTSFLTLIPMGLVVLQGDLGTAVMYLPILLGIMLVAGLRARFLIAVFLAFLCIAPVSWMFLKDYQRQRIMVTFDPDLDPQGIGYQTRQSQIAIGSGGFFGKGLREGLQSQLGFVPEVRTDFIFALLAEETGLVGAVAILLLYLLVLMRLLRIAELARDRAGIIIVTGVASLWFFHIIINVGMVVGVLPAVGIPLPLLSYGGSNTITMFVALGLALNVYQRRFVY